MSIVNLPSGYRQVEYIESSGTQYVDTEFKPNQDTKVIMDAQSVGVNETYTGQSYFGARTSNANVCYGAYWHRTNAAYYIFYDDGYTTATSERLTDRLTVIMDKNVLSVGDNVKVSRTYAQFQSGFSLYLFSTNQANTPYYTGCYRVFSCQIYNNGTLVRDFIPCINPSGVVGLYDLVNAKFYGNSGTGVFTAGRKVYKESEIAKLEYIESDGSQYVDTEFVPSANTKIEVEYQYTKLTSQYSGIYISGAWLAFGGNSNLEVYYGNKYITAPNSTNKTNLTIDGVSKKAIVNGTEYTFSSPTYTAGTNSLVVFALRRSATNIADFSNMKLYTYRIYDNSTLVHDYYPAEVDGAIGLWDAISGVLYTDAAGGTFIAGPYLAVDTPANFEQILAVYLRWGAVDCEAYKIYRNGSLIGTTTDTFYVDITAEQNTEYIYTLIAYRGATESEPTELTVYTRSGYFVIKPLIESAFFQ